MLQTFLMSTLIWWVVQGSLISSDELKKPQSSGSLRDSKSEAILKYMNESADPCESFFDFACGNWKTHHPATETHWHTNSLDVAIEDFYGKVDQLLTTENEEDTEAEIKVKNFYESCTSFTSLKSADYREKLIEIIKEFGEMPALQGDEWQEEDFDWLKTVAEISYTYGINIILGYSIELDTKDHAAHSLDFICKTDVTKNAKGERWKVKQNLVNFLNFGNKLAAKKAKDIIHFKTALGKFNCNVSVLTSMEDMSSKYLPDFDLKKLFDISYGSMPTGDIWENCNMTYIMDTMEKTPKRVVADYIFYQLLLPFMLTYPENKTELEETCRSETLKYFPQIVSSMFYRSHDLKQKEQEFENMWQQLKSTLQGILESSKLGWFDEDSREYALEKLHSMKIVVPLYKEYNFDEEYRQLSLNKHDYLENLQSLKAFNAAKRRTTLEVPPLHTDDDLDLYTPVYAALANTIVVPVPVLATDFFWSAVYPKAINFADLGFTMGHEALHGFSAEGRKFNNLGNYKGDWGDGVEQEFEERRQCLYDQYHNYTFGGRHLPQDESQAENAADAGGILVAYETYRRWYEDSDRTLEELELETFPNLKYTNKQLFFINYAQVWCADTIEAERSNIASSDGHSPGEFRTFVPLTNFGEFAKAFECPKGSAMNPAKQCSIY